MCETLFKLMRAGLHDYYDRKDLKKWVLAHPGQIVSTVSQIAWCLGTEENIAGGNLGGWYEDNIGQLTKVPLIKTFDFKSISSQT